MTETTAHVPATPTPERASHPGRWLLTAGVVAGPLYCVVALAQALTRDGFDLTRHPVSLLSNGTLGWVQIANFVVTGLLVVAFAAGLRRVLRTGRGATWGPRLIGIYGLGLVASGVFVADPADGFPPGTPTGMPETVSWHGLLHFAAGGIGFVALVAACLVLARRAVDSGHTGWAVYSAATGVVFLAGFVAVAAGGGRAATNLAFAAAVVLAWVWMTATAARQLTRGR